MNRLELYRRLSRPGTSKLVLLVLDGLGGLPDPETGRTELESAHTPHLDRLATRGQSGLTLPVGYGITPGSGPAHLALFGYDPLEYDIGRGVLSALGVDLPLRPTDLAARLNFCTLDSRGRVADRRAGRIPSELGRELCGLLQEQLLLDGVQVQVVCEKEHRAVAVFRGGEGELSGKLTDSDPGRTGVEPRRVEPREDTPAARRSAELANRFQDQAREILRGREPANGVLMRGFATLPDLPAFPEVFQLKALGIASYPMYRGLARLVGMDVLPPPDGVEAEFNALEENWGGFDFFFLHVKATDAAGEDGDSNRKVQVIEEVDALIPRLEALGPDVLVVTGDHSTPSPLRSHSWHPVPYLLCSPWGRADEARAFGEKECRKGALGVFPAVESMALMMAHGLRFGKYGA